MTAEVSTPPTVDTDGVVIGPALPTVQDVQKLLDTYSRAAYIQHLAQVITERAYQDYQQAHLDYRAGIVTDLAQSDAHDRWWPLFTESLKTGHAVIAASEAYSSALALMADARHDRTRR